MLNFKQILTISEGTNNEHVFFTCMCKEMYIWILDTVKKTEKAEYWGMMQD